jgi:death on curing protein
VTEPKWLSRDIVVAIHGELIAEHGGLSGVRDEGLLESALARANNRRAYAEPSRYELAAAYGFGLAKNHPFLDGNKRIALASIDVFLQLNGFALAASEVETVAVIRDLAAGEIDEDTLARWIEANASPFDG